jgi:pyruvate/2-oxoglutarate dehydrogenase complex dihydrolipoamide acyltransferase (E2) component
MTIQIKAPMVNVNEDEIELVEWHKEKDQFVKEGELLATFESTKSTYEFSAPNTGYFTPLVESGNSIQVGQLIGYFSDEKGAPMNSPEENLSALKLSSDRSNLDSESQVSGRTQSP